MYKLYFHVKITCAYVSLSPLNCTMLMRLALRGYLHKQMVQIFNDLEKPS